MKPQSSRTQVTFLSPQSPDFREHHAGEGQELASDVWQVLLFEPSTSLQRESGEEKHAKPNQRHSLDTEKSAS